jgi:hypothetical protein
MSARRLFLAALAVLLLPALATAATGTIAPFPKHQLFTNSGTPCASCKLFTYIAGTTTKENTYSESTLSSANTNPIVLDSAGRATIFLTPGTSYKFVLTTSSDSDPPASPIWTVDNVVSVPSANVDVDISATAGEALAANDLVYLSQGDGGRTAGRWYKADADLDYASVTANSIGFAVAAISSGSSGTVRITGRMTGLSALSVGSVYYVSATAGATTTSAPTLARKVGVADSTTSMLMSHWVPFSDASATYAGLMGIGTQTFEGDKTFNAPITFLPGTSTASARASGVITDSVSTTTVGNVGAGEDTLQTYSLLADVLSANGKMIRITAMGDILSSANTKRLRIKFGGTTIFDSGAAYNDSTNRTWIAELLVIRTGATAQLAYGKVTFYDDSTDQITAASDVKSAEPSTPAETLSGAVTILVTGEATNNDEITKRFFAIEPLN